MQINRTLSTDAASQLVAEELVANTERLPPMPVVGMQILAIATDDFIDLDRFAATINRDPAITTRLIGLANSAFFSPRTPIESVEDAIVKVLGLDLARGVAVGMVCASGFDATACPSFDFNRFWCSALMRSDIALKISQRCNQPVAVHNVQLAALIDDIGLLAAATVQPAATQQVLDMADQNIALNLRQALGCSYQEITAAIAVRWELPPSLRHLLSGWRGEPNEDTVTNGRVLLRVAESLRTLPEERDHELLDLQRRLGTLGITEDLDWLEGLRSSSNSQDVAPFLY